MDDDDSKLQGPIMICATRALKSEGARVGKVLGIKMPRTVRLLSLVAVAIGAIATLIPTLILNASFSTALYAIAIGGGLGWLAVTYSPLPGESLAKWLELQFTTKRRSRYVNGKRVTLAVGIAPLSKPPRGDIRLLRSSVHIVSSSYDNRGVLRTLRNRNMNGADEFLAAAVNRSAASSTHRSNESEAARPATVAPPTGEPKAPRSGRDSTPPELTLHIPSKPQRLKD